MLTPPLTLPADWTWEHGFAVDLPDALRAAFPPTEPGAVGSKSPKVEPLTVVGSGLSSTPLVIPWAGRTRHHQTEEPPENFSEVHWIWGSAADLPRFPDLIPHLPFGNPLIAMQVIDPVVTEPDAFPSEGNPRGAPVVFADDVPVFVSGVTILAALPARPGLDTLGVLRALRDALNAAFPTGHIDASLAVSWAAFVDSMNSLEQPLRLLEPSGSPVRERTVTLRTPTGDRSIELTAAHRGDLLAAAGLTRASLGTPGFAIINDGTEVATATPEEAFPSGVVPIDADTAHVDIADLTSWFAPNGSDALERFTRGNHVTPYINGPEFYAALFTHLNSAASSGANGSFYLTGYSLHHDVNLVPSSPTMTLRTVEDVARAIAEGPTEAAKGEARFLALQMLQLKPGFVDTVETSALVIGLILAIGGSAATFGQDSKSLDQVNFFAHTQALAFGLMLGATSLSDLLDKLEPNRAPIEALAALPDVEAHLDPVPATCVDNPRCQSSNEIVELVHGAQDKFNAFHQKIAIVRNVSGIHAFCGGIDLNSNRLDDRDHGTRGPYHDVHAGVRGRAAGELATTFIERWDRTGGTDLNLAEDDALISLPTNGPDIVQVARTYHGPSDVSGNGLVFAPNGERTILDTLITSIRQARRYIYIEDQYLTPPLELAHELRRAADRVSGPLIIVLPETPDQPFGLAPRQKLVQSLGEAWGSRLKVGTMRQRFSRAQTNQKVATGRLWLAEDVFEGDNSVKLGPVDRLPDTPFWLVVDEEAMRAFHKQPETIAIPTRVSFKVDRAVESHLFNRGDGTPERTHKAGAPVTAGSFPGVYVHAKMMLIDDTFASIGSANANRRGYYSDGECNLFAIRESLTYGDNWIRDLRVRLWAELLGLTEEFARTAFVDPTRNLDLFSRKFTTGSRFTPFEAQPYTTDLELQTEFVESTSLFGGLELMGNLYAAMGMFLVGTESEPLFDAFIDPSSHVEG